MRSLDDIVYLLILVLKIPHQFENLLGKDLYLSFYIYCRKKDCAGRGNKFPLNVTLPQKN